MFDKIRRNIAKRFMGRTLPRNDENGSIADTGQNYEITQNLIKYVRELSRFDLMSEEEIYEQIAVWEADAGGAIDRMSTLVKQSLHEPFIKKGKSIDTSEQKCVDVAIDVYERLEIPEWAEAMTEVLLTQGNTFITKNEDEKGIFRFQPNRYITAVDELDQAGMVDYTGLLREGKYLVLGEKQGSFDEVFAPGEFYHIKYKKTPYFVKDIVGRRTWNVHSISPLHRSVLPIWWKRQTMMIDILWRWKNVPREHHKLNSEMFSLDKYAGTKDEKISKARAAANSTISSYIKTLEEMQPDRGFVTLDNTTIDVISPNSTYMGTNDLLEQLGRKTYTSLNIPPSVIDGKDSGSYAAELVLATYLSNKVEGIANKFKPVILDIIKTNVLMEDDSLPVSKLNISPSISISTSEIENFRRATLMASMGQFTDTEIRESVGYQPLTAEERQQIIQSARMKSMGDTLRDTMQPNVTPPSPDTPHSKESQIRDKSQKRDVDIGGRSSS